MSLAEDRARQVREQYELRKRQMEAEAEAQARDFGVPTHDDGPRPIEPTIAELTSILGGPENASRLQQSLPIAGGMRVVYDVQEARAEEERMRAFWMNGGGRLPDRYQPHPAPPATATLQMDDRFVRESLEDGFTWA